MGNGWVLVGGVQNGGGGVDQVDGGVDYSRASIG